RALHGPGRRGSGVLKGARGCRRGQRRLRGPKQGTGSEGHHERADRRGDPHEGSAARPPAGALRRAGGGRSPATVQPRVRATLARLPVLPTPARLPVGAGPGATSPEGRSTVLPPPPLRS